MNDEIDRPEPRTAAPTRREFAQIAAGAAAAIVAGGGATHAAGALTPRSRDEAPGASKGGALRVCHMTDWHVCPERRSEEGSARALEAVGALEADLILTGGDLIWDSFATTMTRADEQWRIFKGLMAGAPAPVEHCVGNHDLWGWHREKSGATGDEPNYGMRKALDELGLESSWRSFDRGGWHFVVLDSVVSDGDAGYLARISAPQMEWLEADLAANDRPTVVVSHIPIISVTPLAWQRNFDRGDHGRIDGNMLHLDGRAVHQAFRKSGNVKLCLSGHVHMIDRCDLDGIAYCNGGAVCGEWWRPTRTHCDPTFSLVDLEPDGAFHLRMTKTGWTNT